MKLAANLQQQLAWLSGSLLFFRKHLAVILGLGLVAGIGRVIQLEAFGPIESWLHISLEVIIESARIMIFLYTFGLASVRIGVLQIKRFFTQKGKRKSYLTIATRKLKTQWLSIIVNIIGFLIIASLINYMIDLLVYETCLYLNLKKGGIIAGSSSEWTVLLFLKNISVIPLAIIFDAIFLLWLTSRLQLHIGRH